MACAESLRQMDFTGRIIILTEENYDPYDRTHLTKWMPPTVDKVLLRNESFLKQYDIEVRKGTKVEGIDTNERKIKIESLDGKENEKIV